MRILIGLIFVPLAWGTDRFVCHVDPPSGAACSTYSPKYNSINLAVAAASAGDRILVVPQSGSCAESGHTGAYCAGNDDCTTPAAVSLGYSNSSLTFTTSKESMLPAAGTRITTDYLNGSSPVVAEVRNPVNHKIENMFTTTYGVQSCNQLRGSRFSSRATFVGTSALDDQWKVPVAGYPQVGDKLIEDSSTGYHYAKFAVTGTTTTNAASVFIGKGLQRNVAICFGVPASGHCVIADPSAGTIGACPTLTSCSIDDWGIAPNHITPDPVNFPHIHKVNITWDSSLGGDDAVYVALANGSTLSYAGDGTSAAWVWDTRYVPVKRTDPDFGASYTCPTHDITIRGLALTGGGNGFPFPLVNLAYSIAYDAELTTGVESGYNYTFDQNLILMNPVTEQLRNPIETAARSVNITNNYVATANRTGSDGSLCCAFPQGPANIANNYWEALPSGIGGGGAANAIHTFPAAIWDFPQTCCTMGWNGTVDVKHNWVWKPEWARAHLWTANYFVQKNSMWAPSGGGNAVHWIAQNTGYTGSSEPAWNTWSGQTVTDGDITWVPESDAITNNFGQCSVTGWTVNGTWECFTRQTTLGYGNPSFTYTAGSYIWVFGQCIWQATNSGTAAGGAGGTLAANCTQGDLVVDGGVTWRGLNWTWAAGKAYHQNDRVNLPQTGDYVNTSAWYYVVSVAGTSGGSPPDWTTCNSEGCTLTDGGVTWVGSFRAGNMYTSKNNLDSKECKGCLWRWNYFFNAFPQNRTGGNQGNLGEWSTQPQSGGPWEEQTSQVYGNVFDKGTVGVLFFGLDPSPEDNWSGPSVAQPCHTNLTMGVNASATAWVVDDSGHFIVNNFYSIGSEWIKVTVITDATHVTVVRAQRSTTGVSHSAGEQINPTSFYYDPSPVCHYNINPGNTHDMTFINNRVTNTMQGLSRLGCDLPFACGGSSGIAFGVFSVVNTVVADHNTIDGTGVPDGVAFVGDNGGCSPTVVPNQYFPNSNVVMSNSILNITGGTQHYFRFSCWGDDYPAINSMNWNIPFVPSTHIADGWPDDNAAAGSFTYHSVLSNESVYGNLIPGATLGGATAAPQTGAGTIPANNAITPVWASIGWTTSIDGLPSDYTIPPSSPAYHIAGDGTSPGADPDQQALINNLTVSSPGTTVSICYDLTSVNSGVPTMLQLSVSPDFTSVPAQLDPSLVAPVSGVTVNSMNFTGYPYTSVGTHHCFVVPGLNASTKYYFRVHAGGQLYGAYAENNPPPSFTTSTPTQTQTTLIRGGARIQGKVGIR